MTGPLPYARLLLVLRIALGLSLTWLTLRGDATAALIVGVLLGLSFAHLCEAGPGPTPSTCSSRWRPWQAL